MDNMLQRPILASKLCEILYEYRAGCSSFRVCDRLGVSITAGPAGREEKNKKTETKLFAGIFTVRFRFITILFCRSRARFNNNSSSDSIIFLLFRFAPIRIKFPVIMIRDRNYYRRVCVYCTCRTVFFFFQFSDRPIPCWHAAPVKIMRDIFAVRRSYCTAIKVTGLQQC